MGRPRRKTEAETVLYKQVEEYARLSTTRIPGLRKLEIVVNEKGKVSFSYEVIQTHKDGGSFDGSF